MSRIKYSGPTGVPLVAHSLVACVGAPTFRAGLGKKRGRRTLKPTVAALTAHTRAATGIMPLPPGFVPPCLPTKAARPPSGELWLHEIKHDGFHVIARKDRDAARAMSHAFDDVCASLQIPGSAIKAREMIAKRTIELGRQGENEYEHLRNQARTKLSSRIVPT